MERNLIAISLGGRPMNSGKSLLRRQVLLQLARSSVGLSSLVLLAPAERLFAQTKASKRAAGSCSIEGMVKQIAAQKLGVHEKGIELTSRFKEDLGADSLDQCELTMAFEGKFEIEIPDADARKLTTVGSVVDYTTAHVSKSQLAQLCPSKQTPINPKAP
jgi:acyl carrier protein